MPDERVTEVKKQLDALGVKEVYLKPLELPDGTILQRKMQTLEIGRSLVNCVTGGGDSKWFPDTISIREPPGPQRPLSNEDIENIKKLNAPKTSTNPPEVAPEKPVEKNNLGKIVGDFFKRK